MSIKVINVVNRSSNKTLYFNLTSEISGEDLTQEQVENLIGMSLSEFIANYEKYRNAVVMTLIDLEGTKGAQYMIGNTSISFLETNEFIKFICNIYIQDKISVANIALAFKMRFNKETKEYITGSLIITENPE